ncbi:MAG: hypothetical protein JSU98_05045 [Gemmatimonadales bacterium]|jgi:hypothetical protein|nr:MAG: hypothetical protein JSU98_05045 [Gemmatimonadales bacterium]
MLNVRTSLVLGTLVLSSGCYRWVPTEPRAVSPNAEVRVVLTEAGAEEMTRYFGPDVEAVEGSLVSWDGQGVSLLRQVSVQQAGFMPTTMNDTIRLAPGHLAEVGVKELDGPRTAGFTALVLGTAAAALLVARAVGGSSDDSGEGGGPPIGESSAGFRIPFSLKIW